jgi:hypothetical protein
MSACEMAGNSKQRMVTPQAQPVNGKVQESTEPAYVTRAEMLEFKREVCDLLKLFLDFYVSNVVEIEGPYIDIHLN